MACAARVVAPLSILTIARRPPDGPRVLMTRIGPFWSRGQGAQSYCVDGLGLAYRKRNARRAVCSGAEAGGGRGPQPAAAGRAPAEQQNHRLMKRSGRPRDEEQRGANGHFELKATQAQMEDECGVTSRAGLVADERLPREPADVPSRGR